MAIWLAAIKRPRIPAGVISAIYIGVEIEAMPMPRPARKRNTINNPMSLGTAVPIDEIRNIKAARNIASLRPKRSDSGPTSNTPTAQPISAQPVVQPFMTSPSANFAVSGSMAPEMTPVS